MRYAIFVCLLGCGGSSRTDLRPPIPGIWERVRTLEVSRQANMEIDLEWIDAAVFLVQDSYNNRYGDNLDLWDLIGDLHVQLVYVWEQSVAGYYEQANERLKVLYPPTYLTSIEACRQRYYTFGHELLHVIAWHVLGLGGTHDIPELFFYYATTPEEMRNAAEWSVYETIDAACQST